jgi:hypothetical protein
MMDVLTSMTLSREKSAMDESRSASLDTARLMSTGYRHGVFEDLGAMTMDRALLERGADHKGVVVVSCAEVPL